jgi:hypothetical protein
MAEIPEVDCLGNVLILGRQASAADPRIDQLNIVGSYGEARGHRAEYYFGAVGGTLIVGRARHQVAVLVAQTVEDGVERIACGRGLSLITSDIPNPARKELPTPLAKIY